MASWMGLILNLLGEKIHSDVRELVINQIDIRVIQPTLTAIQTNGESPDQSAWMDSDSNWNPVCWGGVVIAAASTVSDPATRALLYATAYLNVNNYLQVYVADGWNSEGPLYFNVGYGDYVVVREALYQASNSKLDLFANEFVAKTGRYGLEAAVVENGGLIGPDFGDCLYTDAVMNPNLINYIRYINGLTTERVSYITYRMPGILFGLFTDSKPPTMLSKGKKATKDTNSIRSYFDISGVLIARPTSRLGKRGLAAAFKLLGNKGGHSHNDIGSYIIYLDGLKVSGDMGTVRYTGESFGTQRYSSPIFNSLGHPVPVIDGHDQIIAANRSWSIMDEKVKPFVVSKVFTDTQDSIVYDLKAAYNVPHLLKLTRSITYSRNPDFQHILIKDEFAYSQDSSFESPLIAGFDWIQLSEATGYFCNPKNPNSKLYMKAYSDTPFQMISKKKIDPKYKTQYHRISLKIFGIQSGSISYILSNSDSILKEVDQVNPIASI